VPYLCPNMSLLILSACTGSTFCGACESGTHSLAGSVSCITLAIFIAPPVIVALALLAWFIHWWAEKSKKAAFARATQPDGLHYPCPVLKSGTAVQGLTPEFAQAGSPAPQKYQIIEGELPAGLKMDKRTGVISGMPAVSESALTESRLHIKASNIKGSADFVMVLQVETRAAPADLIYTPDSFVIVDMPVKFEPTLRPGIPCTNFRAHGLPLGLEINPSTGIITGAARDAAAHCSFDVTAFNEHGETSFNIALEIQMQRAPSGLEYACLAEDTVLVVGETSTHMPVFYIGLPAATFKINSRLPEGMAIDSFNGVIAGCPTQPTPRKAFTVSLENSKGRCEFNFSVEVQLQYPPMSLTYPVFHQATQEGLYCIFVYGEPCSPAMPDLKQGNYMIYKVEPLLPPGIEIDATTGVITGRPATAIERTVYTVTASNRKGTVQTQISFAVCLHYEQTAPADWTVDQVQLWAQRALNLKANDRAALHHLNGKSVASQRSVEDLRRELPTLDISVHTLLSLAIEKLHKADPDKSQVTKVPVDAKRGDPASMSMLPRELRGDYKATCVLGNGGHGAVLRLSRVMMGHVQFQVAIKIIHSDRPFPEDDVKRMDREATLLGRIDSPHVVKLKGSGISADGSIFWLVMDFLDGSNMQESIEGKSFLGEVEACDMCLQLLTGLEDIHRLGVVHCDVKPANVMRCPGAGSRFVYKLVDLGVAVAASTLSSLATMRNQHAFRGTPGFICPEVIRDERDSISPQADIWSLGATVFVVLTGLLPFCTNIVPPQTPTFFELMAIAINLEEEPPDVRSFSPLPISADFSSIVKMALKKRRQQRYPSVEAMKVAVADRLHALRGDEPGDQVPASWTPGADRVVLDPLHAEFGEVAALFFASLHNRIATRILSIDRIQSQGQWGLYRAKRRDMELRGGAGHGERRLFHGTDEETVPKIISTAFNRSFCGKNATLYGEGVYFAADAEYSASDTYSRPNARGEKHIFLCSVLVGAYAQGDSSMRVPPLKADGSRFDSTVDSEASPRIFVIYHDAQVSRPPPWPPPPSSFPHPPRPRPPGSSLADLPLRL
jgi:serine/threonine protein kinase